MGTITLEKMDHLLWLGRYAERVYTTVKSFFAGFDTMIDKDDSYYREFCEKIGIPDIYGSKEVFIERYPFDETDSNSIVSNLERAFDNAVIIREMIGSETLSYLQLAVYDLKSAEFEGNLLLNLISLQDHLLAFWGCLDDEVPEAHVRRIAKAGKWLERLDLGLRLKHPQKRLLSVLSRLEIQLAQTGVLYNQAVLNTLRGILEQGAVNYRNALGLLGRLIEQE